MSRTTKLIISMLVIVIIAISFGVGFTVGHKNPSSPGEELDIVDQAWNIIINKYVDRDKINTGNLSRAAIEGMLESLNDPYSSYLGAENYNLGVSSLQGEFEGIGAYVTVEDKQLMIVAPIADSAADEAGIKAGDIILEIDGEPVADMSLSEAILRIRGPRGTAVMLLVLHEGETEPVEIEIIRTTVEVPSVRFEMKGDIAYIRITDFTARTADELYDVLKDMDNNTRGIVIDLRGNPGGLLSTVVDVTSYFLSEGVIVEIMTNQGKEASLRVDTGKATYDLPMVVLVDNTSASGSEVLAGALQDHGRAIVAGNTTYGKGSVNELLKLDDGSGLYLTVARWVTPNGRLIEGQGIEPDIKLEVTGEDAVQWAVDYLTNGE
jgi:carboxyl-terminal processing protease